MTDGKNEKDPENRPVSDLPGVGPKKTEVFRNHGILTMGDLLRNYPVRYEDRTHVTPIGECRPGDAVLLEADVLSRRYSGYRYGGKSPLTLLLGDGTGNIEVVFFQGSYISQYFYVGKTYVFYGKISENRGKMQMIHPEFHIPGDKSDLRGFVPVYKQIPGISEKEIRSLTQKALQIVPDPKEWLPEEILDRYHLMPAREIIRKIHSPSAFGETEEARKRLIFEQLLTLETAILLLRSNREGEDGIRIRTEPAEIFRAGLPFSFTSGQEHAWKEIACDLDSNRTMNRLVQGDVGSGKTILAETAIYCAAESGCQSVFMAPTELLAKQHFKTLQKDFSRFGFHMDLLTGNLNKKERDAVLERLKTGETDLIVGTHAVLQPDVIFHDLGLVITDEQHRFGVSQRRTLREKGRNPNVMVMTATPIPRTLAVVLYGDLDISVIDSMPAGRKPILTYIVTPRKREGAMGFLRKQMQEGHQIYIVCPLIEESDSIDAKSAEEEYDEIKERFPEFRTAVLYGSMKQDEKDRIMERFAAGEIDLLVSTVVIEVGIDVPNATVMVIENCERFGLSQMHQLRGRVGRGDAQSYCLLMLHSADEQAVARAKTLKSSSDGFAIAEADLRLRGPGEIFGTRQHGLPENVFSEIQQNPDIVRSAKEAAAAVLERDPLLQDAGHAVLRRRVRELFHGDIKLD